MDLLNNWLMLFTTKEGTKDTKNKLSKKFFAPFVLFESFVVRYSFDASLRSYG